MRRDLSHFMIAYALAMGAGFLHVQLLNWFLAAALLVFYGYYVWETMQSEGDLGGETKPLYFHRHPVMPHRHRIFLQIGVAIAGIVVGAEVFVEQVQVLSETLGASPLLVSLLVTPIATELPEKFNSVLWIRQRKDTLALGNITGAMVFQSTFPVSIGLIFTSWHLNDDRARERRPGAHLGDGLLPDAAHPPQADVVVAGRRGVDVRRLPRVRLRLQVGGRGGAASHEAAPPRPPLATSRWSRRRSSPPAPWSRRPATS